jgi:septum site-determining protein MinC
MSATDKKSERVTIKGTAGGLLIRLHEDSTTSFAELLVELDERLQVAEKFFRRGRASVELGERVLEAADLERLQAVLARYEVALETIISGANATRSLAKQVGIPYKLPNLQNMHPAPFRAENGSSSGRSTVPFDSAEALFIRRTVRSGQVVQHHADVVILGDVNPGAEIVAGGNVIVWGVVRGRIQAGVAVPGAMICALSLRPTQLGIGDVVAVSTDETYAEVDIGPEMATVQNGTIIIESWSPRRKK